MRSRHAVRTITAIAVAVLLLASPAAAKKAVKPPNDPLYSRQWALAQVRAVDAWTKARGDGVVVAVVDSGVDLDNPDLAGRLVPGATFFGCGPAPCGNGDWQDLGGKTAAATNPYGNGTHMAGIVAAATDNGIGVAGVAPHALVLPLKAIDRAGAAAQDQANAIRYAVDRGADVIAIGHWSGVFTMTNGVDPATVDAVAHALDHDVVVLAAAGDDRAPLCRGVAGLPGVLCVTPVDSRELPVTTYSNPSVKLGRLSVAAPGGDDKNPATFHPDRLGIVGVGDIGCAHDDSIVSTWPVGSQNNLCYHPTGYAEYHGSATATAHVAGVAALLVSQGRRGDEVIDALTATARQPLGDASGSWNQMYGYGIVDAAAAVAYKHKAPKGPKHDKPQR